MSYIGKTPAAAALTSSDISDGIIITDKLAANAVVTSKITDATISNADVNATVITGQSALTSVASDDTVLISDTSASGALKKMTRANFVAGIGGANTPAFEATISTEQNPSSASATKINFDSEVFDIGGVYNTSNKRFTPGVAGRYFIYCNACIGSNTNTTLQTVFLHIYKNGSALRKSLYIATGNFTRYHPMFIANVIDLDANDYIEMFTTTTITSGTVEVRTEESFFGGYKLIT